MNQRFDDSPEPFDFIRYTADTAEGYLEFAQGIVIWAEPPTDDRSEQKELSEDQFTALRRIQVELRSIPPSVLPELAEDFIHLAQDHKAIYEAAAAGPAYESVRTVRGVLAGS